jgi:tRNA-Thr(GGU) m(6)t(6)A37 methyltransferase TsaA
MAFYFYVIVGASEQEASGTELKPIGIIHSPYREQGDAPHQGRFAEETAELDVFPEYLPGLKDIERVTHLIVLYWGHRSRRDVLQTRTPFGPEVRGVFACRAPSRPNPIAFCVADLLSREGGRLLVRGVDAVDGSPLLDIKPYSPAMDSVTEARIGWMDSGGGTAAPAEAAKKPELPKKTELP